MKYFSKGQKDPVKYAFCLQRQRQRKTDRQERIARDSFVMIIGSEKKM